MTVSQNTKTKQIIEKTDKFGANNYHPLPIVISKAEGVWVERPRRKSLHGYA